MTEEISHDDRVLTGAAYAVGVPAIYIIMTEKRNDPFVGAHGVQALFYWVAIMVLWVGVRVLLGFFDSIGIYFALLDSLSSIAIFVLWVYALYSGFRAYMGETFDIPIISGIAKKNF
ncbi:hypothetical protein ACFLZ2_05165 [Candidatus Margulisiibacteriota bacterium]